MSELKSCPLCGSRHLYQYWCDGFHIGCFDCQLKLTDHESELKCEKKWNKRTFTVTEN